MSATAATVPRRSIASFRALPSGARVFMLCVGGLALAGALPAVVRLHGNEPWGAFSFLAVGAAIANIRGVTTGRHHRLDTAMAFVTAAALLLPIELVAFMGLAQHGIDGMRRRYPWFAQVFNISNSTLTAMLAWAVHREIVGTGGGSLRGALGAKAHNPQASRRDSCPCLAVSLART